jgi:hypothetical protein
MADAVLSDAAPPDASAPDVRSIPCPGIIDAGDWLCGSATASTASQPSDVLIVLDRSASMLRSLTADCLCAVGIGDAAANVCSDAANCTDRWTTVKRAIGQVIDGRDGLQWGLAVFPSADDSTCSVAPGPQLPIAGDSGAKVKAQLDAITPVGNTPIAAALDAATAYLSGLSDGHAKYIMLVTDGTPECSEGQLSPSTGDMQDALAASGAARRAGLPVYVIGAGPAASNLDEIARKGGTTQYYPATSISDMVNPLMPIEPPSRSCTFSLPSEPPDADNVVVYIDGQFVPQDASNGWTYGYATSEIVITGSYCEHLITAESMSVQILLGCPGVPPPMCIP